MGPEAVRKQLREILISPGFARNERLSRFLEFTVERHMDGRDCELKESVIGSEVFGRSPGYNPKLDPIVRTEARRLRTRLSEYYESAGRDAPVVIELPKGGYVPLLRPSAEAAAPPRPGWASLLNTRRFTLGACAILALVLVILGWRRVAPANRSSVRADSPAYDLLRRARASEIRPRCLGVETSIELFEEAIAKDRTLAPVYAGLASMEAARSGFDRFSPSERTVMNSKGMDRYEKGRGIGPHASGHIRCSRHDAGPHRSVAPG